MSRWDAGKGSPAIQRRDTVWPAWTRAVTVSTPRRTIGIPGTRQQASTAQTSVFSRYPMVPVLGLVILLGSAVGLEPGVPRSGVRDESRVAGSYHGRLRTSCRGYCCAGNRLRPTARPCRLLAEDARGDIVVDTNGDAELEAPQSVSIS
jgi:hypothetical protein